MSGPFRYISKNFTYLANPRYLSGLMYETCNITNIYAEDIWNTNVLHKDMPNYTLFIKFLT